MFPPYYFSDQQLSKSSGFVSVEYQEWHHPVLLHPELKEVPVSPKLHLPHGDGPPPLPPGVPCSERAALSRSKP